jgi:GT2 family glycosyltransferase
LTIAVIVVGHNSERWLASCFAGFRDAGEEMKLIYVDNASSDGSVGVVESLGNVVIIRNARNLGFGEACNVGARFASVRGARVLFFLNPDTRATAELVTRCATAAVSDDSIGMVGPLQIEYGSRDSPRFNTWTRRAVRCADVYPSEHFRVKPFGEADFAEWLADQLSDVEVWYVNGGAFAIRSEVFEACGGFDPAYFLFFEEVDLARRARWLGFRAAMLPDAIVEHAWGGHESGIRLREWTRSKYQFVLTDASLPSSSRLKKIVCHLARDAVMSLRGEASAIGAIAALTCLGCPRSAVRRSRNSCRQRDRRAALDS